MLNRQTQFIPEEDNSDSADVSYILSQLEVYNWGPFRGLHRAEFDPNGTAIIGPTGSGKTTLIDALMTLLVLQPRYNLASTGGHESDRTLISYVRGVLGGDGSDGREEVARPGTTITGICATYRGGEKALKLAGLLWTEGSSNAADDLKRCWLFSFAEDQTLETWLRLLHEDGVRELVRTGRETANLRVFDSKKAYLAGARRFFDVSENAFTLLNRAAGLKQLNSIDEIFRDLVLDDRSAFDRALEVAGEFDNLAGIHAELETARKQQESLIPVADEYKKLLGARSRVEQISTLKGAVPVWYAIAAERKWSSVLTQIFTEREKVETELETEAKNEKTCHIRVETLREGYLKLGGNVIGELETTIDVQKERVAERTKRAMDYRHMVKLFGLNDELRQEELDRNQRLLGEKHLQVKAQRERKFSETLAALSKQRDQEAAIKEIESEVRKVKERPGSNIPPRYQDFRAELSTELALHESDVPFLAELVEVKSDQAAWRGAIERAIGSERLCILVPEMQLEAALRWVNSRDNRLHVRLQRARHDEEPGTFFTDGYTRKLNFKKNSLIGAAKRLLARRDLHCVSSPETLKDIEHGLTIEGMTSGRDGRFEKQDQRRLNEEWMTGFDNKDQLDVLVRNLISSNEALRKQRVESEKFQNELSDMDHQLLIIDQLLKLEFATIDVPGTELDLTRSQERLAALLDPNSDASQAKLAYDAERKGLEKISNQIREFEKKIAVLSESYSRAEEERGRAEGRARQGLNELETRLATKYLVIDPDLDSKDLADAERIMRDRVDEALETQIKRVADIEQQLVRKMDAAQRVDTGALADTGSEIKDVPVYLERLRVLTEEALPEKRNRFLEYLNRSSDQGVTQLLASINEEVDEIEQRIRELNQTLAKVDFRSTRYLQLQPQRIQDERLRTLDVAMRKVRSAALKDDGGEGHYKALQEMVGILREAGENRRQQGSKALLDARFRLQFFVVEVDRQTGDRSPPRTGSQSGSGGEKELMASHILTASLSYALCPKEAIRPLYGTVVLDEAFSKSSPSAASRIIEALRIFYLHPIFVTPNKEIGLLRQHTRRVICVQRPGKEASLASISWEKLEELANSQ